MFIDLARACGLWLPIRGRKWGLWKEWQGKVQGMKPGTKSTTTPVAPRGAGLMPSIQSLPSWPIFGGFPNSTLKGSERVSCTSLFGWGCGTSLVGYWNLCYVNRGIVVCPKKEGREKGWEIRREVPLSAKCLLYHAVFVITRYPWEEPAACHCLQLSLFLSGHFTALDIIFLLKL